MPDTDDWRNESSSRRKFLKVGTAGGVALFAGCSGDGGGDGTTGGDTGTPGNGTSGGGETVSGRLQVFDPLTSGATPTQRHLNPWNPSQSGCWHPGANIFDRPVVYSPTQNEAYPLMVTEWGMTDDTTLEATFSDEWTWHNGDQFVAQDWVMQRQIEHEIQRAANPDSELIVDTVEATDDHHVRIQLNNPLSEIFAVQNTIGILNGNLARGVFTKHDDDQWSQWHEQLRNSEGDERTSVVEELTSTAYPMLSDDPIGHGPFQISEVGDDSIVMTKYEDHPHADNINFEEFSLNLFSQTQPTQPYSSGQVDAAHKGFPITEDLQGQLPEEHTLFREGRSSNKLFTFNCGHEVSEYDTPFSSPNVRKAVAHVFDRQQVSSLLQGVNQLFEWPPCRVPGKVLEEGSHEAADWVSDFTLYGQNDTERATTLLEEEGYSQEGGQWMNPDSERFEINIMNGAQRSDIQVLKQNLSDFGISVTQEQVDDATFDERRTNGEYDIMPDGSSSNGITSMWAISLVADWIQSISHFQPERDVPMPVGDPDGGSGTKTINVAEHIRQWQSTGESQYHKELLWWWNQTLPEAEMMYQPDAGAYNAANWEMDVRDGIYNGVDDALYLAPKMEDGTIRYTGN